ncbi:phage distal tail protein [Acaricomes phytoseiuli]|uniref:phage distal tail protein n=1 Tax=Acaricomes phytoseiuli TaxID=291968 RepID=UPI00146132BC|nr:phage tail domain-containing protein [Acaricomes phytoseiuli]
MSNYPSGVPVYVLPERQARITLANLIFNEWNSRGYLFKALKIRGWKGKPGVRRQQTERLWAHGVFTERGYSDARPITIEGRAFLPTEEAVRNATIDYGAILQEGGFDQLIVDDPIMGEQWATVGLEAGSDADWHVPGIYPFQLQLFAPDPRKYSAPLSGSTGIPVDGGGLQYDLYTTTPGVLDYAESGSPGTVTLTNPGSAPASPVFTITGEIPEQFSATEIRTGRRLIYEGALVPQSVIRIDSRTGSVTLNGETDRSANLVRREWQQLGPQATGTWLFEAPRSTNARMSVEVTPAWW